MSWRLANAGICCYSLSVLNKRMLITGILTAACSDVDSPYFGECTSSSSYTILAMKDARRFEQSGAKLECKSWTQECSSKDKEVLKKCECTSYKLSSPGLTLQFSRLKVNESDIS